MTTPLEMAMMRKLKSTEAAIHELERLPPAKHFGYSMEAWKWMPGMRCVWPMGGWSDAGFTDLLQGRTLGGVAGVAVGSYENAMIPYVTLNGTTQYLYRASENALNYSYFWSTGMTWGGWFRPHTAGRTEDLIGKWTVTGNQRSYRLHLNAGALDARVSVNGTAVVGFTSTLVPTINEWNFMVGRFTASGELAVWLNQDKQTFTTAIPASIFASTASFTIGAYSGAPAVPVSFFDGDVGACFLDAMVMSDDMIAFLYQQTAQFYGH